MSAIPSTRRAAATAAKAGAARPRTQPAPTPNRDRAGHDDAGLRAVSLRRGWVRVVGPMALAATLGVLVLMAVFHALVVQGQRELDRIGVQIEQARVDNDRLQLELAEQEAPQRIVARARSFGMVEAPEVVYLSPSVPDATAGAGAETDDRDDARDDVAPATEVDTDAAPPSAGRPDQGRDANTTGPRR